MVDSLVSLRLDLLGEEKDLLITLLKSKNVIFYTC